MVEIEYREDRALPRAQVIRLYEENEWSSAQKPDHLLRALAECHALVTAWDDETLVGLGYAISDGHLVVYYPHLLVLPTYRGQGIGRSIMQRLLNKYVGFHQHMLVADGEAIDFYRRCGFRRAGATEPMWIYDGDDH